MCFGRNRVGSGELVEAGGGGPKRLDLVAFMKFGTRFPVLPHVSGLAVGSLGVLEAWVAPPEACSWVGLTPPTTQTAADSQMRTGNSLGLSRTGEIGLLDLTGEWAARR